MRCAVPADIGRIRAFPTGDADNAIELDPGEITEFRPPHTSLPSALNAEAAHADQAGWALWVELKSPDPNAQFERFSVTHVDSVDDTQICGRFATYREPVRYERTCYRFADIHDLEVHSVRQGRDGIDLRGFGSALAMGGG